MSGQQPLFSFSGSFSRGAADAASHAADSFAAGANGQPRTFNAHFYTHRPMDAQFRRAFRYHRRGGPCVLPLLIIGGAGYWAYSHLKKEINEVKMSQAGVAGPAAAVATAPSWPRPSAPWARQQQQQQPGNSDFAPSQPLPMHPNGATLVPVAAGGVQQAASSPQAAAPQQQPQSQEQPSALTQSRWMWAHHHQRQHQAQPQSQPQPMQPAQEQAGWTSPPPPSPTGHAGQHPGASQSPEPHPAQRVV